MSLTGVLKSDLSTDKPVPGNLSLHLQCHKSLGALLNAVTVPFIVTCLCRPSIATDEFCVELLKGLRTYCISSNGSPGLN